MFTPAHFLHETDLNHFYATLFTHFLYIHTFLTHLTLIKNFLYNFFTQFLHITWVFFFFTSKTDFNPDRSVWWISALAEEL